MSAKKQATKVLSEISDEVIAIQESINYGSNVDFEDIYIVSVLVLQLLARHAECSVKPGLCEFLVLAFVSGPAQTNPNCAGGQADRVHEFLICCRVRLLYPCRGSRLTICRV